MLVLLSAEFSWPSEIHYSNYLGPGQDLLSLVPSVPEGKGLIIKDTLYLDNIRFEPEA